MIKGPKIELWLERYSDVSDGGGGLTRTWESIRKVKGILTFGRAFESVTTDKETVKVTYQFWAEKQAALDITERDRFFMPPLYTDSYRYFDILFVDNILEDRRWLKIDLQEHKIHA